MNWKNLRTASGPATRVPRQIEEVISGDSQKHAEGVNALLTTLVQSGRWFSASAPAVDLILQSVVGAPEDAAGSGRALWLALDIATAVTFAREGARVFCVDANVKAAQETVDIIKGEGGEAHAHLCNVANAAEVQRMAEACATDWGRIDVLHNNVGIARTGGPVEMSESDWDPTADNPTSTAYGIPQALTGGTHDNLPADYMTNPVSQIEWGLWYIKNSYGSACAAWEFKQANNWY